MSDDFTSFSFQFVINTHWKNREKNTSGTNDVVGFHSIELHLFF